MGLAIQKLLPKRRLHRVLVGVLLLLVVAWFAVPQLFVPKIRAKLQGMIAGHLDARLQIGRMMYAPPFGVRARDVRLIAGASAGPEFAGTELLKVAKLDLKLARHPFHEGPLVIQNITVHDPEVHVIRTADGRLVGMHNLVRPDAPTVQSTQPTTAPVPATQVASGESEPISESAARAKVSDMFELRHFGINGGRVVFEDRSRPGLPPVVWKDLNVGMETTPQSRSRYGYTLNAEHGDLAQLKSSGSFDLDELLFDVGSLHVEARTTYTHDESPLPAQVQRVLRDYRVEGRVLLDADGKFSVRDREGSAFRATVELRDASGYSPLWDATVDRAAVKLGIEGHGTSQVLMGVQACEIASGDTVARLDKGELLLDGDANAWTVREVVGRIDLGGRVETLPKKSRPLLAGMNPRGTVDFTFAADGKLRPAPGEYVLAPEDVAALVYPRNVSLHPPKSPAPINDLGGGGSIRKERGTRVVVADNLTFAYGTDPVVLTSARLQLPADLSALRDQTRVEEIGGTIDFRRPGPRYPGKFGRVVESLRPVGPFVVGRDSWFAVSKVATGRRKGDWYFSVSTDAGSFTLTEDRIELLHMTGDATVSNMLIDVRRLEADVLGGKLTGTVQVTPGGARQYQGRAYLRGVDLAAVSKVYILPETRGARLSGVGNLNIEFAGEKKKDGTAPLDTLRAAGEFEVFRGHFWTVPVLGEIAKRAGGGRELTVGEAAGVFEVEGDRILLRSAAVSSPALGLQGSGSIGPERRLDLDVVAAPLGDWRDKVKQTNVPIVSDVAGEVVGAVQKLVNTATSTLLYEFRVTGTAGHPHLAAVPVPALSDAGALLFGGMMREGREGKLLESLRPKKEQDRARPEQSPRRRNANP
jgi:hypothetical protein